MSASQRTKGIGGEREVANLLREALDIDVTRNWQAQSAIGGFDLTGIPGWAIEVKRAKTEHVAQWWQQTVTQAQKYSLKPVLIYRIDGHGRGLRDDEKWQTVFLMTSLVDMPEMQFTVHTTLRAWIFTIVRQGLFDRTPKLTGSLMSQKSEAAYP